MRLRTRLVFLFLFLILLILAGYYATGGLGFIADDFWFSAGLILLLLCALIDQPFFSNNSDILLNGIGAAISLLAVDSANRTFIWWLFLGWSLYLILSSYTILWIRSKALLSEHWLVRSLVRLNRKVGCPQVLFSAFFLWGVVIQLGLGSRGFSALFIYWAAFILSDFIGIGRIMEKAVEQLFSYGLRSVKVGQVTAVLEPGVAIAEVVPEAGALMRKHVLLGDDPDADFACGYVIDDRRLRHQRLARLIIPDVTAATWRACLSKPGRPINMYLADPQPAPDPFVQCIGVVEEGSNIEGVKTVLNPGTDVGEGRLLMVELSDGTPAYYQLIGAQVQDIDVGRGELYRVVAARTQQLGKWNQEQACFESITWVAPAGVPVNIVPEGRDIQWAEVRSGRLLAGLIPRSDFPIYVDPGELVSLNTAILGVTGCGKSFLAFYLIESLVEAGIKVLVLDMSRQHRAYLGHELPSILEGYDELHDWLNTDNSLAVWEFATNERPTKQTSVIVQRVFNQFRESPLPVGRDYPARLCVVFEEAHSLIPEWNQCDRDDQGNVNTTARYLLQFRKYGIGSIVISQRTANVTKTILNQCNTIFAMQCFDQTGFDFLKNYMGEGYARSLSILPRRHAVIVGKASSSTRPVIIEIPDMTGRWSNGGQCADATTMPAPVDHLVEELPEDFGSIGEEIPF